MDRRLTICILLGVQTWESPLPFLWQPPPPLLNTFPARLRKNRDTQFDPQHCWMFPPPVPRAGYAPSTLPLFDTQRRSYTSVVVWNFYCDQNLRRFKQINDKILASVNCKRQLNFVVNKILASTKYTRQQIIFVDKIFASSKYWCQQNVCVNKILASTKYIRWQNFGVDKI